MTAADLIKQFEGFRSAAYRCPSGLLTCGWGHTFGVSGLTTCTAELAEEWLAEDLNNAAGTLVRLVRVPLTNNQRESILSFVFNTGETRFASSTLLRKLNAGDFSGAAAEFERWVHGGGRRLPGLAKRRAAERALFETPDAEVAV